MKNSLNQLRLETVIQYLGQGPRHLKGPHGIHVGGHDGNAIVSLFGVPENDLPVEVYVRPALEGTPFRPQQDIFEVQLYIIHYVRHADHWSSAWSETWRETSC